MGPSQLASRQVGSGMSSLLRLRFCFALGFWHSRVSLSLAFKITSCKKIFLKITNTCISNTSDTSPIIPQSKAKQENNSRSVSVTPGGRNKIQNCVVGAQSQEALQDANAELYIRLCISKHCHLKAKCLRNVCRKESLPVTLQQVR